MALRLCVIRECYNLKCFFVCLECLESHFTSSSTIWSLPLSSRQNSTFICTCEMAVKPPEMYENKIWHCLTQVTKCHFISRILVKISSVNYCPDPKPLNINRCVYMAFPGFSSMPLQFCMCQNWKCGSGGTPRVLSNTVLKHAWDTEHAGDRTRVPSVQLHQ